MRQKYIISKKGSANDLTITEYAVIGKKPNNKTRSAPFNEEYDFLYQQIYKGKDIEHSLLSGSRDLIEVLRTENLYPTGTLAIKIAEIVVSLYLSSEDGSTELLFDDIEHLNAINT